jgi:hypothetical protein
MTRAEFIAAAVVAVPLLLWWVHVKFGDFWPVVIWLGTAAFMIFVVGGLPRGPLSCFRPDAHCSHLQADNQTPWLLGLVIVLPLGLAVAYKELRGDKRGVTGTWPAFRPGRRR